MNTNIKLLAVCILAAISLIGCSSLKMTKEEKAAQEAALRSAIEQRAYIIDVNRMIPMKGGSKTLTSPYSLEIKGDTINSYLPYFGEAYNIPYGGGKGLNFRATITGYNQLFDSKGKAIIEVETKNEEDRYLYSIEIFPGGSTSISVRSYNRQPISFYGTASEITEK
ncbi:MAG: DUF4251 domain-containing protein [Tannerella sp.]|jgi:hypothetical protein|nr:DUF4251 domain-containing protein [Tannerella sp.]